MKKTIMILLAAIIIFNGVLYFENVYGNEEDFIIIDQRYKVDGESVSKINPNQNFELELELKLPKSAKYDVSIDDNTSFVIRNSLGGSYTQRDIKTNRPKFNIYYKGGDDTAISLRFEYDGEIYERTVHIDVLSDSASSSPSSRSNPRLIVSGGSIPIVNGGEDAKISIPIENIGTALAKNVTVLMELDENSPFEIERLNTSYTIDRINARKSENAIFSLKVQEDAEEKIYPIKLSYHYSNMHSEEMSGSDTINIRVQSAKKPAKLILSAVGYGDKPLIVNERNTISLVIRNTGSIEARDVKVSLKGLGTDGFTLYKGVDVKQLQDIGGNKVVQLDYELIPSLNMVTANYDLSLKIDYKDHKGNAHSEDVSFFLPVKGIDTNLSDIVFENIDVPDKEIKSEEIFKIAFDLVNKSKVEANEVKVSLETDKDIICKSLNVKNIGRLSENEHRRVEFELYPSYEAVTRNYPIRINVDFENGLGEKKAKNNVSQYVGVFVDRGSGSGTPRIIVDRYSVEPATIKAGDTFQLNMSLFNTSSSNTVSNIKLSLSSDDGVFTPVNSSNTTFIESIAPKGKIEKVFTLTPKRDAEHKTYGVMVDIDYEDGKGNQLTSKDMISIDVIQQVKLVLGDLYVPPEVYIGQPFPVSMEFFNMGKTTLYNLMIKTQGDFSTQDSNYYVGNFEPGKTDYYEVGIIPEQEGSLKGEILFTFENAVGDPYEVVEEFEINSMEMFMEPMPDFDMDEEHGAGGFKGKFSRFIKNPYTIVGSVLVFAAVIFGIKRMKKKKREMTLDE